MKLDKHATRMLNEKRSIDEFLCDCPITRSDEAIELSLAGVKLPKENVAYGEAMCKFMFYYDRESQTFFGDRNDRYKLCMKKILNYSDRLYEKRRQRL